MSLPAGYYRIDPDIRALVAAMNVHGFRTYASCQGHGFPVTKLPPYIAFVCPVKMAALLEQRLRQDAESVMPRLMWGWSVGVSFSSDLQLCFRLQPEAPHCWYHRYCRRSLRADFRTLISLLKSLSE
ncbi:hypothetical protein [Escherichia coli]|uniref:hypothetical protein n=1 Tax=Escherichia coli TaxID=562 RepID=UPI00092DC1F8|nr:hypothetical protein [Escherichia coli]APL06686.1 hypothetical protein RG56_25790 [Escherichia coli]APL16467.1 hypothetical protein RG58_25750 [Escherichia coli]APL26102.1 hypothetical protein RG60_25615 [Escherichia coli]APL31108.1 hypothetical protein RG61_25740 [Escherichia coli]APL40947.1 hypothetical protein RG63_25425 [Escherichia coli]